MVNNQGIFGVVFLIIWVTIASTQRQLRERLSSVATEMLKKIHVLYNKHCSVIARPTFFSTLQSLVEYQSIYTVEDDTTYYYFIGMKYQRVWVFPFQIRRPFCNVQDILERRFAKFREGDFEKLLRNRFLDF